MSEPEQALEAFIEKERGQCRRIVLAAPSPATQRRLARAAGVGEVRKVTAWRDVEDAEAGAVLALALPQTPGFRSTDGNAVVVTALDVLAPAPVQAIPRRGQARRSLSTRRLDRATP